jgi:hypothetical protein
MGNGRVWLFRFLVLALGALLVVTWFMPWWTCYVEGEGVTASTVVIHPYGLDGGGLTGYFELMPEGGTEVEVPGILIAALWVYFGLAGAALLLGLIFNNKTLRLFGKELNISRWLVGIVGFSYILVAVIAYFFAKSKVDALGIPFSGEAFNVNLGKFAMWDIIINTDAGLRIGYFLTFVAGGGLLLLGLLRNKIVGNS